MIEEISIAGFIMFIFGFAGTMFFDDPQSKESKISQFAFTIGLVLVILTILGAAV